MQYDRFLRDNLNATTSQIFVSRGREYILGGEIGDGAIGIVRRANDRLTKERFAVKFLAPEPKYIDLSSFEDIYARFKHEGKKGAALSHEHLVQVLAYEENENGANFPDGKGPSNPFILMEYIQGTTLEKFLQKRSSKIGTSFRVIPQTLYIAYAVADALLYLHKKKLVHRDVKPANIYLTRVPEDEIPIEVKLGDFGIVKWGDFKSSLTSGTLTTTGQPNLGTLKYMPFEQALNPKSVDVRSDMYSFGITMFELFTNQILPNIFYVLQLTQQRSQRSNTTSRLHALGLGIIPDEYESLFTRIYDTFVPTPGNRPSSNDMVGRLKYYLNSLGYSRLYEP